MKKIIVSLALFCLAGKTTQAQELLNRVPSTASMVIKYSGENFSRSLPLKKLDSYGFIRDDFFKTLRIDTLTSLQNIGIDFEKDIYQYVSIEDTCMNFITLLPLKNEAQFLKLVKANYSAKKKTIKKNGFNFLPVSDGSYIGWNKTTAMIVNATYQNRKSYYDNYYSYPSDSTAVVVEAPVSLADSAIAMIDTAVTITEVPAVDTAVIMPDSMAIEVVPMETESDEANEDLENKIRDSLNNLKWELWQQQDMIAGKQQRAASENIMGRSFSKNIASIKNDISYTRIIDPAAHASVWINTESIMEQYWKYFYRGSFNILNSYRNYNADTSDGFKSSVNMYFEKERLRMEQKTFSANARLDALAKNVMNSKQSNGLVNYVNPDNIGYFSMSINTEAMANYYYTYMKKYLANIYGTKDYADIMDLYIDLLEIIIDEKAIAELLPGNYLFVMHDMKPQIVNYTDYEYDDEFNRKEVKKTRKELSPDFTFALETRRENFMKKITRLPLKYAEKDGYNYKEKEGGYYELAFKEGQYPFSSLFFMVKDGKVIITTSKEVIDMTISNKGFAPDEKTRNSILSNNYSLNINSKKLIAKLETQVSTDVNKKITDYLLKNLGDLKMESSLKDGMIQGTTTLNITGNHSNSLEFFFNMMDAINSIMEKDRQEKEKKLY
ncbi:MAG: hypothetical protein IPJ02_13920 [Chitinophagaceae bacterium]|nr:hypothetical protein [Chitinophagaceae bacterium]